MLSYNCIHSPFSSKDLQIWTDMFNHQIENSSKDLQIWTDMFNHQIENIHCQKEHTH